MAVVLVVFGVFTLVAQVLVLRQLVVVFHGTELHLSATLACWLFLTGLGSAAAGRLADRVVAPVRLFAWGFALAGLLLPATLVALRAAPRLWLGHMGAVVPYWRMVAVALSTLAPLCVWLGFLFTVGVRALRPRARGDAQAIGAAYVLEAAGTFAGGLLFSFVLVRWVGPLEAAAGLGVMAALTGFVLWTAHRGAAARGIVLLAVGALLAACAVPPLGKTLDFASKKLRLPGYTLRASVHTPYGQYDVAEREGQRVFFSDGMVAATDQDGDYAEETVHLALLAHPDPRRVLLLGGGASGLVTRILHHPSVERVDYVELDPAFVSLVRRFVPEGDRRALASRRVRVYDRADARRFVQEGASRYDVIVLAQPDPTTGAINRLYTLEFFAEARRRLRPGGLLALSLSASPGYMIREMRILSASIYRTLEAAFGAGNVALACSDASNHFLAGAGGPPPLDADVLARRYSARGLQARYLTPAQIRLFVSPFRTDLMRELILSERGVALNRDLRPITYYYAMLFRGRLVAGGERPRPWERLRLWHVTVAAGGLALLLVLGARRRKRPRSLTAPVVLFAVGFAGIVLEMVLLFVFQSLCGVVYLYMALLFSAFMVGLSLGGVAGLRIARRRGAAAWPLLAVAGGMASYALVLPAGLIWLHAVAGSVPVSLLQLAFGLLAAGAGAFVGLAFPLAASAARASKARLGATAGVLYGADVLGACLGALLSGAFLIPALGLLPACGAAALWLAAAVAQFLLADRRT